MNIIGIAVLAATSFGGNLCPPAAEISREKSQWTLSWDSELSLNFKISLNLLHLPTNFHEEFRELVRYSRRLEGIDSNSMRPEDIDEVVNFMRDNWNSAKGNSAEVSRMRILHTEINTK